MCSHYNSRPVSCSLQPSSTVQTQSNRRSYARAPLTCLQLTVVLSRSPGMGLGICGSQPCLYVVRSSFFFPRVDKKFYRPTTIQSFAIVVFERKQRFNENDAREVGKNLLDACRQVGIIVQDTNPSVFFANGQNGVVRVSTSSPPFLVFRLPCDRN
jgi:hypothetical protein